MVPGSPWARCPADPEDGGKLHEVLHSRAFNAYHRTIQSRFFSDALSNSSHRRFIGLDIVSD
jgi:hypothetical protein